MIVNGTYFQNSKEHLLVYGQVEITNHLRRRLRGEEEKAIQRLAHSPYDQIVTLIKREEFVKDPMDAYKNKIFAKGAPLKTAVVWNEKYIDFNQ